MSGRVVHFEIPVEDGDRARRFYTEAFGRQLQEMPGMDYTLVTTGPGGDQSPTEPLRQRGMPPRSSAAAPAPVVDVDSIDRAPERVTELGGSTVLGKQPVGGMGFTAYVRDPEGNVIGLWETAAPA